jgi:hypothetical protein
MELFFMARPTSIFVIWLLSVILFHSPMAGAQENRPVESPESQESSQTALQFEEAVFEANGSPYYLLNARARVKNTGVTGYRGSTVHFFCRLDPSQDWTFIGQRPLPGVRPGNSVACDLVTSSEGLPIVDSQGEISHCLYRIEIRYQDEVTVREGEFHPSCLHDH